MNKTLCSLHIVMKASFSRKTACLFIVSEIIPGDGVKYTR